MSRRFASDQVTSTSMRRHLASVLCSVDCVYQSKEPGRATVQLTMSAGAFDLCERFTPAAAMQLAEAIRRAAEQAQCLVDVNALVGKEGGAA